jgi:Fe-S cluster assembly protein SufD
MQMTQSADKNISWYLGQFDAFERSLNGESKDPVHQLRKAGIAQLARQGFPTSRHEEWRFTNIAGVVRTQFAPAGPPDTDAVRKSDVEPFTFRQMSGHRLVFVNGHFVKALSTVATLPSGVRVESLADALKRDGDAVRRHLGSISSKDESAFTALNTSFMLDGAFISVPDGVVLESPIHLLYLATGKGVPFVSTVRNLIVAGERSQVSIIESYANAAGTSYMTNVVTEMIVGRQAVIEHDKYQDEARDAFHIGSTFFLQEGGSTVVSNSVAVGGSIVRNNVNAVLNGEQCECTLNGLSIATGDQLIDNHTVIDHAKPNCVSHELYKSVLDGKSRGVFNGKIFVRKDAQKTDAKQTNRTLLLSDDATIDTKPQLEIFADDVKCTHGATVGQLDDEQLFYLRSRGIARESARDILTVAFAADVVDRIHVEPLRNELGRILAAKLRKGRESLES